jgi:hypothetical protein
MRILEIASMKSIRTVCVALAASALLAACENTAELREADLVDDDIFRSYVALGNSITAGYQSGGINDSTQSESYARLIALQIGHDIGRSWIYPRLGGIGCPPPVNNFATQTRVGNGTASTCSLRDTSAVRAVIHNVAVPGAASTDPHSQQTANSNLLTNLFLGGQSQVDRALDAAPTFASIWIGNNDALVPGVSGILTPTPGISPGLTALATFQTRFDSTVNALIAEAPGLRGVLIGVVQIANAPILFPAAALQNPQFKAGLEQIAGKPITVLPNCTATSQSLISFQIIPAIRAFPAANGHPPTISCDKSTAVPPANPVGEIFVLDQQDIATLTQRITAYNAHIEATATRLGWAYWDPNPLLVAQRAAGGCINALINLQAIATGGNPFGACMSLDGVHPARRGHQLIANGVIGAINAKYTTTIPTITVP